MNVVRLISLLLFLKNVVGTKVVIVGAGVSGLTAATELAIRGFDVVLYERQGIPGGKVKAYTSPNGLPMEHGFHFFAGGYQNLPRTFSQIPYKNGTLYDRLVTSTQLGMFFPGKAIVTPERVFDTLEDILQWLQNLVELHDIGCRAEEVQFFADRMRSFLLSSDARRHNQFQNMSYEDVMAPGGISRWSVAYYNFFVKGLVTNLVASDPAKMSADTMLQVMVHMLLSSMSRNETSDRLFNGPGDEVWTEPWVNYLKSLNVKIIYNAMVTRIVFNDNNVVSGIEYCIKNQCGYSDKSADYYLVAVPVERMVDLAINSSLFDHDPMLKSITKLETSWMNGLFVYL